MTWLQPWAWLGAATILLPILIHLLGRGQSRTHRFPSLRFIDAARQRFPRMTDDEKSTLREVFRARGIPL